jgi:hypothetical protein
MEHEDDIRVLAVVLMAVPALAPAYGDSKPTPDISQP